VSEVSGETYRGTSAAVRSDVIDGRSRWPVVCCVLVTIISVPVWFFAWGAYVEVVNPSYNPFAVVIYAFLCLISMAPVALLNAGLIAPLVARPLEGKGAYARALLRNALFLLIGVLALVGWAGLLAVCGKVLAGSTVLRVLAWTIIPWQLAILLLPPMVAGSLAYSTLVVASRHRMDKGPLAS
jgi:hypothetical protein